LDGKDGLLSELCEGSRQVGKRNKCRFGTPAQAYDLPLKLGKEEVEDQEGKRERGKDEEEGKENEQQDMAFNSLR
jgi:hypothetical protein